MNISIQNTSLYDIFTTFFTVFGAITSGLVLGFTVVSYMVYDKYEEDDDNDGYIIELIHEQTTLYKEQFKAFVADFTKLIE